MLIGVCGYGATGSSAIVGLLKEYPELCVVDKAEIQETFKTDGLQDLEYHLVKQFSRHMSGDMAIKRYKRSISYYKTPIVKKAIPKEEYLKLSNEFVDSLIQGQWWGIDNIDYDTGHPWLNLIILLFKKIIFPNYEKLTGREYNHWPARKMYLSIKPEAFYKKSIKYTDGLMRAVGADLSKTVVFDQVFEGNAPENSFPFFRDPKAIVIDRDPRDLWLLSSYSPRCASEGRFMPRKDVRTYVEYFKQIRKFQDRNREDVLFIQFEDLIYDYSNTVKTIEAFVGCKDHVYIKKYFQPEKSIANTQLHNNPKYKNHFIEDIAYIEKELKEYLYSFENYPSVNDFGKVFSV